MRLLCTLPKHLTNFGIEVMISKIIYHGKNFLNCNCSIRGVVSCAVVCRTGRSPEVLAMEFQLLMESGGWLGAVYFDSFTRQICVIFEQKVTKTANKCKNYSKKVYLRRRKFLKGEMEMHATLNACKISTTMHCAK